MGTLYIVSTPIGNLKDITLRALDILASVSLIAAEDTRKTAILLRHYEIETKMTSYFDFNKEKKTPSLLERLKAGNSIAVVSDAGTPGISDPAFYLVRAAVNENISVEAIPGATAFVPALIVSGLPTDRFVFEGFLPAKKGRQKRLNFLKNERRTIVLYESPKRIVKTLGQLFDVFGDRRICIARELTKKFEEIYRGNLEEFCSGKRHVKQKGEFVIIIEGRKDGEEFEKN
ncbi:16S rRNA (cytidine(1402)-2'-O)-methyltransferase [candidate division KSB1 bacterium]|nr:16S rRNA (cytidine(1402)-2'-O)-methyltransferase [candidate division KSB1 bacterium]